MKGGAIILAILPLGTIGVNGYQAQETASQWIDSCFPT